MSEHSVIYLSPSDDPEREWCQDDVWENSVRYNLGTDFDAQRLRADTAEAELKRLDSLDTMQLIAELTKRNAAADQRIAELEGREVVAETEGVLTFMRSDSGACGCCGGHHIFCRYFEGVRSFEDFSQNTRFRNDLEGRRFRISIELMPDAALSTASPATINQQGEEA